MNKIPFQPKGYILLEGYILYVDKQLISIGSKGYCFSFGRKDILELISLTALPDNVSPDEPVQVKLKRNCRLINLQPLDLYKPLLPKGALPFSIAARAQSRMPYFPSSNFSRLEKDYLEKLHQRPE